MQQFIAMHGRNVTGVLNGWDRVLFRGMYRLLACANGLTWYLNRLNVRLTEFKGFVQDLTARLVDASQAEAARANRPCIYLDSSAISKEEEARTLLRKAPVESGLIGVWHCVEPCWTYELHRNAAKKKLELVASPRKCAFYYHYYRDPEFGFMHVRMQTWVPFSVQVCLNGREWLARRMDETGLSYRRADNCFPWIEDFARAQALMDGLGRVNWPRGLDAFAHRVNPGLLPPLGDDPLRYYWTARQSEWATDVAFDSPRALASIYPQLAWGAITGFSSADVLRFLQRRCTRAFSGEVTGDFKDRAEGIRVKHTANGNSVKMYDKQASVLRIETTVNNPGDLKVYRASERDPQGDKKLRPLRKGVADFQDRARKSQKANEHYLDGLAVLDSTVRLDELFASVSRPAKRNGKRVRALRVWTREDQALLAAVARPEFLLAGFKNADIAKLLYPEERDSPPRRRAAAARVSYRLGLLRAHGLIHKLPNTRRYRTSPTGQQICTAATLSQKVTIQTLTKAAA